jgi:hypothetical protein
MISQDLICDQLDFMGVCGDAMGKKYLYMYCLLINGLPVLKPGRSEVHLAKRIHRYLNVEHMNQAKSHFNILAIIEFDNTKKLKNAETFIKNIVTGEYNIFSNQPFALEQYQLVPLWNELKSSLENFPFSKKVYIMPKCNIIVKYLASLQITPYGVIDYESRASTKLIVHCQASCAQKQLIHPDDENSDDVSLDNKNSANDSLADESSEGWFKKVNSLNINPHSVQKIKGMGPVSAEAFIIALKKSPISIKSFSSACADITAKIQKYNRETGHCARYNALITWLNS